MPTLLLTPRYSADSRALRLAAIQMGWDHFRLESWRIPGHLRNHDLVFYGEPLLAEVVAESLPYVLMEPTLDWLPTLPAVYLQRAVRLTTLGEARALADPAFVKPAGPKSFPAGVYTSGAAIPLRDELPEATPVLVAEPVVWEVEFRCFVLERRVATFSPYLRRGALAEAEDGSWPADPEEVTAAEGFAAALLADAPVRLPPAVALDIGRIEGRGWAVVEANAAWGSGLYGCDPEQVLAVLRRATVRRTALTEADLPWVPAWDGAAGG
jgi:hypothetical protein